MRLKPLPKIILFALGVYAMIGTYWYFVGVGVIPAPPKPTSHKAETELDVWAWNQAPGLVAKKQVDSLATWTPAVKLFTPPVPKQFPFSVAVAWLLLIICGLGIWLFLPKLNDDLETESDYMLNGEPVCFPKVTII